MKVTKTEILLALALASFWLLGNYVFIVWLRSFCGVND